MASKPISSPRYNKYIIRDGHMYLDIHGEFQPVAQFAYEFERWEDAVIVHNVLLRSGVDVLIQGCGRRIT